MKSLNLNWFYEFFNPLCVVLVGYVGFDYTIYLARSCLQLYVFNNGYCMSPT